MQQIIDEKLNRLKDLGSAPKQYRIWKEQSDLWYWLYSALLMEGYPTERSKIVDVLAGGIVDSVQLDVYNYVHGYSALYKDFISSIEMDQAPDLKLLSRWGELLFDEAPELRKGNPVVYEWNHIAPAEDIKASLEQLLKSAEIEQRSNHTVAFISKVHLEFLRLYPYGEKTLSMGLVLLAYMLLRAGYPLPTVGASDIEYNKFIDAYVNKGESEDYILMMQRSILNRLDIVVQIKEQAVQN